MQASSETKCRRTVPVDLNRLIIPNPCDFGWENMTGDDKRRLCSQCDRYVYNLSEMTAREAVRRCDQKTNRLGRRRNELDDFRRET